MAGGNPLTRRTLCIGVGATVAMAGLGAAALCGQRAARATAGRTGRGEPGVPLRALLPLHRGSAPRRMIVAGLSWMRAMLNMRTPRMEFSDCYPGQLDDFRYCDFCAERNGGVPPLRGCVPFRGFAAAGRLRHPKPRSLAWRY